MIYQKLPKKEIPEKVTKAFMFDVYLNQMSEKTIREELNYYNNLLGFNVRNRKLNDIIVLYFIARHGLPQYYNLSPKLECQFKKLGFLKEKNGSYLTKINFPIGNFIVRQMFFKC